MTRLKVAQLIGVCVPGEGGRGGFLGGQGGVEDGAVPVCGHHCAWSAVSAGHHLAALCGQHCQLEGVQLRTSTQTHADRRPCALKSFHFMWNARRAASINPGRSPEIDGDVTSTSSQADVLCSPCVCVCVSCAFTHADTCAAAPDVLLNWDCDKAIRSVVTQCSHTHFCLTSISLTSQGSVVIGWFYFCCIVFIPM